MTNLPAKLKVNETIFCEIDGQKLRIIRSRKMPNYTPPGGQTPYYCYEHDFKNANMASGATPTEAVLKYLRKYH